MKYEGLRITCRISDNFSDMFNFNSEKRSTLPSSPTNPARAFALPNFDWIPLSLLMKSPSSASRVSPISLVRRNESLVCQLFYLRQAYYIKIVMFSLIKTQLTCYTHTHTNNTTTTTQQHAHKTKRKKRI
jgi:hypothetical protein